MPRRLPSMQLTADDRQKLEASGYQIGKAINSGEYGVVYAATRRLSTSKTTKDKTPANNHVTVTTTTNTTAESTDKSEKKVMKCAAKVINMAGPMEQKDLQREIFMMNRIKHPHVIEVFGMFRVAPAQLIIFMEFAEGGDLCDLLAENRAWMEEYRVSILYRQFGGALKYIHMLGFAHRDIKLENVLLVDKERTITKLTDFGFARDCYSPETGLRILSSTWCGTVDYMPPEILIRNVKSNQSGSNHETQVSNDKPKILYCPQKADVWSVGVLLFLLLNDDFPFGGNGREEEMVALQRHRNYTFYNDHLSDGAKAVLHLHFEPDPQKRPTMEQILAHSWFDENCWMDVSN